MRVVIDAAPLLVRSAGVKNYLYHWILHLRRAAGRDVVRTFPRLERVRPLRHDGSIAGWWKTVAGLGALAASNHTPLPVLDWLTRDSGIFHASVLARHPPKHARLTATIYDLTCTLMPQWHTQANLEAERSFAEVARRADGLIAISEATRDDAIRVLGLAPEKLVVIHPGIPPAYFSPESACVEKARQTYGLGGPYALFVGTIEPRKNVDLLLDAYESLPGSLRERYQLVVAGSAGWSSHRTLHRLRHFRYLGYVPESLLPGLVAGAALFVYPSLYEGFGFPVVQAMAAGVPVITSNVSSLPEVAGDAALLVDPNSQSELHHALSRLMTSAGLCSALGAAGRKRAERFHWEESARRSVEFFERVAG
ncbi:MAG TPA: glycosyltransferase family 1 protein [Candidatus Acidoferrales bacterium]|nr:glycosyltransferase family 1 protein [Candidatus Acidoferrales bacterium]